MGALGACDVGTTRAHLPTSASLSLDRNKRHRNGLSTHCPATRDGVPPPTLSARKRRSRRGTVGSEGRSPCRGRDGESFGGTGTGNTTGDPDYPATHPPPHTDSPGPGADRTGTTVPRGVRQSDSPSFPPVTTGRRTPVSTRRATAETEVPLPSRPNNRGKVPSLTPLSR